jgi:hypothetical protein
VTSTPSWLQLAGDCQAGRLPPVPLRYLGAMPDDRWRALLTEYLGRADEFRVHVPDGEGPLSYGRAEFLALPGVAVRPWTGMDGAIEITGVMTSAVRDLFIRLEPSIESFDPERKLWDYQLLRDGTVILSVGDYHDLQIDDPPSARPPGHSEAGSCRAAAARPPGPSPAPLTTRRGRQA